jgi:hypothetical protein
MRERMLRDGRITRAPDEMMLRELRESLTRCGYLVRELRESLTRGGYLVRELRESLTRRISDEVVDRANTKPVLTVAYRGSKMDHNL